MTTTICASIPTYLNEVQFPKELRVVACWTVRLCLVVPQ